MGALDGAETHWWERGRQQGEAATNKMVQADVRSQNNLLKMKTNTVLKIRTSTVKFYADSLGSKVLLLHIA